MAEAEGALRVTVFEVSGSGFLVEGIFFLKGEQNGPFFFWGKECKNPCGPFSVAKQGTPGNFGR